MSDQLERERWERMHQLHKQYESLRAEAERRNAVRKPKESEITLSDDSGTAARLRQVFGIDGSPHNAWWTTWRPKEDA